MMSVCPFCGGDRLLYHFAGGAEWLHMLRDAQRRVISGFGYRKCSQQIASELSSSPIPYTVVDSSPDSAPPPWMIYPAPTLTRRSPL